MNLRIDLERIAAELEQLATFSDAPAPAVTRIVFTAADLEARRYLKDLSNAAHLDIARMQSATCSRGGWEVTRMRPQWRRDRIVMPFRIRADMTAPLA